MKRIQLTEELSFSQMIHGLWRLMDWNLTKEELLFLIEQIMDFDITTFDHADIYGSYQCEERFGEAISLKPSLRAKMEIVTKCDIKLVSNRRPEHRLKHYDTSKQHIIQSVERSLKNFRTDYIDVLLLHRPDPLMDPAEVAEVFSQLKREGKVRAFGVSNFLPSQVDMLSAYLQEPLVTNQIELSVIELKHFHDGTIDKCLEKRMPPMAWSPLTGGRIFKEECEQAKRLNKTLAKIAEELNTRSIDSILYAWLLHHPVRVMPIIGSGKLERIQKAVEATEISLTREQWFEIWISSLGHDVS
ncbi:aldo/keto reductase [Halalkalibacterium ligniniphilum]|uniref:aldo/keto reductase n=1 Tax=Halalkalibacterium ligniniphilum TaxID=1134413 RepID=UPI00034C7B92|nr:aldo/keto reductase [Halalkalibacterium ligniniphilum]